MTKLLRITAFILFLIAGALKFYILPHSQKYPSTFIYSVDVVSLDNFYDEARKVYLGAQLSKTKFFYETIAEKNGTLTIRNVFEVSKMTGEKVFAVERTYGIDAQTGQHVKGSGDRDRDGYLFAPNNLQKEDYVYWHINYDTPAHMKFQKEDTINGLKVFLYASDYHTDQTANLGFLPGVPTEKGINLDIHLEQWIEPLSGYMVKYEDNTTCFYYDQKTKQRLYPWNKFNNKYSTSSIDEHVEIARKMKKQVIFNEIILPLLLSGVAFLLLALSFIRKGKNEAVS